MFEHYTVAGFVGGLAPWTMSFHKLFFELALIQGKQSRIVLPACHLYCTGSHSWGEQCWLLLKSEPPFPDQWCRETEQSPGARGRHGTVWQDLGGERMEIVFLLCSQDDTLVLNTGFLYNPSDSPSCPGPTAPGIPIQVLNRPNSAQLPGSHENWARSGWHDHRLHSFF